MSVTLTPNQGPAGGGTLVSLLGPDVGEVTAISFGGLSVAGFDLVGPGHVELLTPPQKSGLVDVIVTTAQGSAVLEDAFEYLARPSVISIEPNQVPTGGASGVVITGSGFVEAATTVNIEGQAYTPSEMTATSLTFSAPAHEVGTVEVTVSTAGGTSDPVPAGLTYLERPIVAALTPSAGPLSGASGVVLTGANFRPGQTTVTIDGVSVTPTAITSTSLIFNAPAHAAGNVVITVSTPFGDSDSVAGGFTYTDGPTAIALAPSAGPLGGTASVVLTGTGFLPGATTVNFDGGEITPTNLTATSLTFAAPAHVAATVSVSVTTVGGTSNAVTGGFTYRPAPTLVAISPLFSPLAGRDGVILSGTGFVEGGTTVILDGRELPATVTSTTTLSLNAPNHAAGNVSVSVRTIGGTSANLAGGFTYTAAPVATSLQPTAGPLAGFTGVVLTGLNFVPGNTTITLDGSVIVPTAVTATTVTFNAPGRALAGNVAVSVTNPVGTAAVTGGFTYTEAPTVGMLTPAAGPIGGVDNVTLTGGNFVPGSTTVVFDGMSITPDSVTTNSLIFDAPAHVVGVVSVSVVTDGGPSGQVIGGFTYLPVPTADLLSPAQGPVGGTAGVTLTGSGFSSGSVVNFGAATIAPTSVSPTSLTFNVPAGTAGAIVDVSVRTPGGTSNNVSGGFAYIGPPTATAITPDSGHPTVGTPVTVTGTFFVAGQTSVVIGGNAVPAGSVTVDSPTSLRFTTPSHVAGNVDVTVTTPYGGPASIPGGYTYESLGIRGFLGSVSAEPSGMPQNVTLTTLVDCQPGDQIFVSVGGSVSPSSGFGLLTVTDALGNTYRQQFGGGSGAMGGTVRGTFSSFVASLSAPLPAGSRLTIAWRFSGGAGDVVLANAVAVRGVTTARAFGLASGTAESNLSYPTSTLQPVEVVVGTFFSYTDTPTVPVFAPGASYTLLDSASATSAARGVGAYCQYKLTSSAGMQTFNGTINPAAFFSLVGASFY